MSFQESARFRILCAGFVLCGIVTVLPGPLLPVLAARWGLPDVQSGAFFAAEFAASTLGAILAPRRLRLSLPAGYALMTAGLALLALAGVTVARVAGPALAVAAWALIGLGIGLSVTATNLTVAGGADTAARGDRARRLSIVNLWWGAGAVACPWMMAEAERNGCMGLVVILVAVAAAAIFAAILAAQPDSAGQAQRQLRRPARGAELGVLVFFAVFLFLYVGVESAVGGWIATYAHRFSGMTVANASLMVSVYWMAMLAGRGLGSVALHVVPERAVWLPGLVLALAAVAALVEPHARITVFAAVAAAGLGFGPVFPVGVSRMLGRIADHRNTGWVFAMCSGGGAALPWLTGLVSTRSGSLRVGFAVPVAALAAILLMAAAENAVLHDPVAVQVPKQQI